MPWHFIPNNIDVFFPGGDPTAGNPPFGNELGELYTRSALGVPSLFFTDPGSQVVGGPDTPGFGISYVRPVAAGATMEWVRGTIGELRVTLHQTDGVSITHSVLLPRGTTPGSVYRNAVPDEFVFIVTTAEDVTPGVYTMAATELTGAPALGDGLLPTVTLRQAFSGQASVGTVLVGDEYFFLEHNGLYHPSGQPQWLFSKYDVGSGVYTVGLFVMPDECYQGLNYILDTAEIATPVFLVFCPESVNDGFGTLYVYDDGLNTLTVLVRTQIGIFAYAQGELLTLHGNVGALDRKQILFSPFGGAQPFAVNNAGTPTSAAVTDVTPAGYLTSTHLLLSLTDVDWDLVDLVTEYSTTGIGGPWLTAILLSSQETDLQADPTGSNPYFLDWDSVTDVPLRPATVHVRVRLTAPTDSVGVTSTPLEIMLPDLGGGGGAPPPPDDPSDEDRINAANLEDPLETSEVLSDTGVEVGKEVDIVLKGKGFTAEDDFGDPRVRAVLLKNSSTGATQVFDFSRFRLGTLEDGETDILNLRVTIQNPGTYDVYLLDKDGTRIARFLGAVEVG